MATALESPFATMAAPATSYSPIEVQLPTRFVAQVQRTRELGRRKQRRREDARFAGNPHVVPPTTADYELFLPRTRPTFPAPPPQGIQRSTPAPSYSRPVYDAASAQAGNFRLSVRGVQKTLARAGPRMQALVATVEDTLLAWRDAVGVFQPADGETGEIVRDAVFELRRAPAEMVWAVPDPWTRYVVHCVARFHGVVSVSVDDARAPGGRATKLLRPHATRRDAKAAGLHSPATTDHETSSAAALESDIDSEFTTDSEQEPDGISLVDETPRPQRVVIAKPTLEAVEDLAEGDDEGADSDAYELLSASSISFRSRDAD